MTARCEYCYCSAAGPTTLDEEGMVGGESPGRGDDLWPLVSRSAPPVRSFARPWPWALFRSLLLFRDPSR
jgi:hypothetical protein